MAQRKAISVKIATPKVIKALEASLAKLEADYASQEANEAKYQKAYEKHKKEVIAYAIANVIIIPLTGFLGEYFGRKNYYVASMILFTAASYMCGQSDSLIELIIWRFIQGVGGGALLSTSQAILFDAFEPKDRPMAAGLFGMGIVLGPTLGPTVGGYIIEHFNWPLIFMINIPIGIIATILSITFIVWKDLWFLMVKENTIK